MLYNTGYTGFVHNSGKDRRRGEGERGGGKQWEVVLCKKMKVRRFLSVLSMSLRHSPYILSFVVSFKSVCYVFLTVV